MSAFSIGEYREAFGSNVTREKNWEPGIGEPATPSAPGRSIEVTPEMQAREAAERASRERVPQTSWSAFRSTLSEDNLRKVRRPVAVGRQPGRSQIAAPRPKIQRVVKPKPAPKAVAPPISAPKEIPKAEMTNHGFTIHSPVSIESVSALHRRARANIYRQVYDALRKLKAGQTLPVEVIDRKSGQKMATSLGKMARIDGMRLKRGSEEGFFFFYLVQGPEAN